MCYIAQSKMCHYTDYFVTLMPHFYCLPANDYNKNVTVILIFQICESLPCCIVKTAMLYLITDESSVLHRCLEHYSWGLKILFCSKSFASTCFQGVYTWVNLLPCQMETLNSCYLILIKLLHMNLAKSAPVKSVFIFSCFSLINPWPDSSP